MKKSYSQNWYKFLIGISMLVASSALFIFSINSVGASNNATSIATYPRELIPINSDGSITIRLAQDQLDELGNSLITGTQNVNLVSLSGNPIRIYTSEYDDFRSAALVTYEVR